MTTVVKLPWPPSVNMYWRRNGGRYFIAKKGMDFRQACLDACIKHYGLYGRDIKLAVLIEAYPPDKRKRDLDNILKPILDGLAHAKVFEDDVQVDKLTIWRCMPMLGELIITLHPIGSI